MPKKATGSPLTREQISAAVALLDSRPPVVPGTRAIINDAQRKAWFDKVVYEMGRLGVTQQTAVSAFCDLAGVAD